MDPTALRLSEEYDDDLLEPQSAKERAIRRRSSKACDNCRKQKCKCEASPLSGEPCRNCQLLGLTCTFLGPSRKRGPPKGYIDAIESRLHQLEAILGTMISSADPRARTLIADLQQDPLANQVIARVDGSPFGTRARFAAAQGIEGPASGSSKGSKRQSHIGNKTSITPSDDPLDLDPHEWQDKLEKLMTRSDAQPASGSQDRLRNGSSSFQFPTEAGSGPSVMLPSLPSLTQGGGRNPTGFESSWTNQSNSQNGRSLAADVGSFFDQRGGGNAADPGSAHGSSRLVGTNWTSTHPAGNQRRRLDSSGVTADGFGGSSALSKRPGFSYSDRPRDPSSKSRERNSWSPRSSLSSPSPSVRHLTPISGAISPDIENDDAFTDVLDITDSVGQLSIDDHKAVRYHGPTSGLHLLASASASATRSRFGSDSPSSTSFDANGRLVESPTDESDDVLENARHRKGVWHFPPPGVWPPIGPQYPAPHPGHTPSWGRRRYSPDLRADANPPEPLVPGSVEEESLNVAGLLPPRQERDKLIELYFVHVHPVLPVLHKAQFMRSYRYAFDDRDDSMDEHPRKRLSLAVLFGMIAIASRYTDEGKTSVPEGKMWTAGVGYADHVREIIYRGKIPSRVTTVQALVLVTYFDAGVGAMAAAWHSSGLALRVAQDVGLHRSIDKWQSSSQAVFFTPETKETYRRTWYCMMLIDNYVATYIGRPLSLWETSYDTELPDDFTEDSEKWISYHAANSLEELQSQADSSVVPLRYVNTESRIISCFRERVSLSMIMASIMHKVYAVNSRMNRASDAIALEARLNKWYNDLPEHLQYNCPATGRAPAPHIITLHMDYWCTVLLLNRPFIRVKGVPKDKETEPDEQTANSIRIAKKCYDVCTTAANRLVSLVSAYSDNFELGLCPAFLTYYIFTASIMHLTILIDNPGDVQSMAALRKTMDTFREMSIVWPSARRARDIMEGFKVNIREAEELQRRGQQERAKRPAEDDLERQHFNASQASQVHQRFSHQMSIPSEQYMTTDRQPRRFEHGTQSSIFSTSASNVAKLGAAPSQQQQRFEQFSAPSPAQYQPSWGAQGRSQQSYPSSSSPYPSVPQYQFPQSASASPHPHQGQRIQLPALGTHLAQGNPEQAPFGQESFWGDFPVGDPFGDPSTLSTSLYNLPLLPDPHRPVENHQLPPFGGAPSVFFDQSTLAPSTQRYPYENIDSTIRPL